MAAQRAGIPNNPGTLRAYEDAAGPAWPSVELTAALAKADGAADEKVKAKIRPPKF